MEFMLLALCFLIASLVVSHAGTITKELTDQVPCTKPLIKWLDRQLDIK